MTRRAVVFNADDLGISTGTNAGIRRAAETGLVRETSMCVTGLAAEEGAETARALPDLGVGLHLSFTLGQALTQPLRGLTDDDGNFLPMQQVLTSCLRRKPERDAVEQEVRAQLHRLRDLGIEPTHLNGHHHVHVFPGIREAVLQVVQDEAIPYMRIPSESARTGRALSARRLVLRWLSKGTAKRHRPKSLPFVGIDLFDRADYRAALLATARKLEHPATEWMVHPREPDDDFARADHHRDGAFANYSEELAALADPALVGELAQLGIEPARYSEL